MIRFFISTAIIFCISSPLWAASGPFFSLHNTDFVVTLAFLLFMGTLIYFKVPSRITTLLDDRAAQIKSEIDEARALRDEAAALLASYERKSKEVQDLKAQIIDAARKEAEASARQAHIDIEALVERRLETAKEKMEIAKRAIASEIREKAISIAVEVAAEILSKKLTAEERQKSIDASIGKLPQKFLN